MELILANGESVNTDDLVTINTFSLLCGVTTVYIYKLIIQEEIDVVNIDGVHFVDKNKYKEFFTEKKRNSLIRDMKTLINKVEYEQHHNTKKSSL